METHPQQETGTRELVGEPLIDDGRDRGAVPVGTDDVGNPDAVSRDDGDALLPSDEIGGFGYRWQELQAGFVDEPQRAVARADELVSEVMQRIDEGFANERERLEAQWGRGEDVSTEDLRVALQRYRSFFRRLLSA
ncbi:MAG: hypothetical protein QOG77_3314 [Solirubrobacteraceae bacterium]|jgi:hypothetical protein|nr:hypothetical protein [Solirubrobacteraceae bacterium]